jgi:acetyl-CoA C-acetyltransferase
VSEHKVVIVAAARTPFGKLGGVLSTVPAVELGATVIREVLRRAETKPEDVSHLIMGTVVAAGMGQVPARQAGILAGLPSNIPSFTINKVCASALKAVNLGAMMIRLGEADVVVAGGMESMSRAPYLSEEARFGARMGDKTLVDSMIHDGLICPICSVHMGVHGDEVAKELGVSREAQDEWAQHSQVRYQAAKQRGFFAHEITGVEVKGQVVIDDEQPRADSSLEKLQTLKPIFVDGGSVTAGNAPGINDGAAAVLLMSEERAKTAGLQPSAYWISSGDSAADHPYLATVPATAIDNALEKTQGEVTAEQLKLVEINEAFASVAITSAKMLNIDPGIVNVNGGAIAIGHPIGASGARILMTLIYALREQGGGYGAAGICSGTAQGEATIVKVEA